MKNKITYLIVLVIVIVLILSVFLSRPKIAPIKSFKVPVSYKMARSVEACKPYYKKK